MIRFSKKNLFLLVLIFSAFSTSVTSLADDPAIQTPDEPFTRAGVLMGGGLTARAGGGGTIGAELNTFRVKKDKETGKVESNNEFLLRASTGFMAPAASQKSVPIVNFDAFVRHTATAYGNPDWGVNGGGRDLIRLTPTTLSYRIPLGVYKRTKNYIIYANGIGGGVIDQANGMGAFTGFGGQLGGVVKVHSNITVELLAEYLAYINGLSVKNGLEQQGVGSLATVEAFLNFLIPRRALYSLGPDDRMAFQLYAQVEDNKYKAFEQTGLSSPGTPHAPTQKFERVNAIMGAKLIGTHDFLGGATVR